MADTEHLADITLSNDNWFDLAVAYPSLAGAVCQIQVKGSTDVIVACSASAIAPVDDRGHKLGFRDALNCSAAHIWVKGIGAQIAVAKIVGV